MTAYTLKIIALISMTIDHLFKVFPDLFLSLPLPPIPTPLGDLSVIGLVSLLGRISFPLFAYIIAESCRYTKNRKKLLLRLLLFAIISEVPYDFAFYGGNTMLHQNVMWTFLIAAISIFVYEDISIKPVGLITVSCFVLLSYYTATDYRGFGVLLIFVIYLAKTKPLKILSAFFMIAIYYLYTKGLFFAIKAGNQAEIVNSGLGFIFTSISILILAFYNGKRGRSIKWFFYLYYPLHLVILGGISLIWI